MTIRLRELPVLGAKREAVAQLQRPSRLALRRFCRNVVAVISVVVLLVIIFSALFPGVLTDHGPNTIDLANPRQGPSAEHRLGTDGSGRDVLARLLYGARVSLGVGFASALVSVGVGTLLGALAGLAGGWLDTIIMRTADMVLSFPSLVVLIVIAGILGPSVPAMVLAIGLLGWPGASRVVRGITLSLREREYVLAARSVGAGRGWILRRHILPGVLSAVVVVATLDVAAGILVEAGLSFLGLGVQPPQPSWGNMLNDAQSLTVISSMPWLWLPPGILVALSVLSVNFIGDGLRDAADPRQSR